MKVEGIVSDSVNMPVITTQMESTPGNLYQRRNSDSSTHSASRAPTPETHMDSDSDFNPPSYSNSTPDEKEGLNFQARYPERHQFNGYPDHQTSMDAPYSNDSFRIPHDFERCDLLPTRPVVWLLKGKDSKLSSLAATVLLEDKLISSKELILFQPHSYNKYTDDQGPPDPITGILTATHRTVVGVLSGVADYPVAISKVVTEDPSLAKGQAASFALDSNKGVSRIVGTALKAPMEFTLGISQGFHNTPKLFGDSTVRKVGTVTGVGSGFKAAGKGFGLGLYDGITGLVTQPVNGAKENGVAGFVGGFWKGIAGVVCKPAAGAVGLPGYAFKGIYEEIWNKRDGGKEDAVSAQIAQGHGWAELEACSEEERREVVSKWWEIQGLVDVRSGIKVQSM